MANPAILKHVGRKCSDVEVIRTTENELDHRSIQKSQNQAKFNQIVSFFSFTFIITGKVCARQINV